MKDFRVTRRTNANGGTTGLLVPVLLTVAGKPKAAQFLLDTAADRSYISTGAADMLGLEALIPEEIVRVATGNGTAHAKVAAIDSLAIDELTVKLDRIPMMPFKLSYGQAGVLGWDILDHLGKFSYNPKTGMVEYDF